MREFDSEIVAALVERARTPLDSGAIDAEVQRVLDGGDLSPRDRGQLLLAMVVMQQGTLSAAVIATQVAEAIELLRCGPDLDALLSAIAIRATVSASAGDRSACLASCLEVSSILRANPDTKMSSRSGANFGAALIVLGAFDLAAPLFMHAIHEALKSGDMVGVVVSCTNLAITVSRQMLVRGESSALDAANIERLDTIDQALHALQTMDRGLEMTAFIRAVSTHSAQLRGDTATATSCWGDLDALTAHSSESFTQYFCLIEAPLAIEQGNIERAQLLIDRALEHLETPHIVPLGRVDALKLRSRLHEQAGDVVAALRDARAATDLALQETHGFADLLIGQVDDRAALEHSQQALLVQASHLSEQALVDELSQVGNRRAYQAQVKALTAQPGGTVAVLLCDIDRFKTVNDQLGHSAGDHVITRAAAIATEACGTPDQVFRYGGDEFVILCRTLSVEAARSLAETIRSAFEREQWTGGGRDVNITCSIGVWVGPNAAVTQGVAEADRLLYEAKKAGGNLVSAADPLLIRG